MQITTRNEFAADPTTVYSMFVSEDFLEQVCEANQAIHHEVSIAGQNTRTLREVETPSAAAKFAGSTMEIIEELSWGEANPDGSRAADLDLRVAGLPVRMTGTVVIAPSGAGTIVDYDADLQVNLPFVGKKLEQSAAPALLEAIRGYQQVGDRWLAERG